MQRQYLDVPFRQKDEAKALGARWDGAARRWYVPDGLDLEPFAAWRPGAQTAAAFLAGRQDLPAAVAPPAAWSGVAEAVGAPVPVALGAAGLAAAPAAGVTLSQLLGGVAAAVAERFAAGVWTAVEVVQANLRNGHVFLEVAERDADGRVLAKAQAAVWARTAARILPAFEQATGATIGAGIKLLVRARPVFKPQYGFSLEIDAIDPAFTLGDLEARRRDIRRQLQAEGIHDRNRRLPAPWDYRRVLVVAPEAGAGLGDFRREADRLERFGLCRFAYATSRFQGEGAAREVLAALRGALAADRGPEPFDAVAIIRGGGAVNDLAWLDDLELARGVCLLDVPVIAGIGHERDRSILDEVANLSFDTPSKAVAGIEQHIVRRTREARAAFEAVVAQARQGLQDARGRIERDRSRVEAGARSAVAAARHGSAAHWTEVRLASLRTVHRARHAVGADLQSVRHGAARRLAAARQDGAMRWERIQARARAALARVRTAVEVARATVAEQGARDLRASRRTVDQRMRDVGAGARQAVADARRGAESLVREIAGQGPEKTLGRGFALVRAPDGRTVTSARAAAAQPVLSLRFGDGSLEVRTGSAAAPADGAAPAPHAAPRRPLPPSPPGPAQDAAPPPVQEDR
ncbi:MAG: exodeoxyribonuclease VII large subunit [Xylophilus ampelinus]